MLALQRMGANVRPDGFSRPYIVAMALATAVGRVGDFLAAEDGLGKPTTLPWGVPIPGVNYLVHPAPLYDAAFNLAWLGGAKWIKSS